MIGARLTRHLPGHKNSGVFASYVHAVETGEPMSRRLRVLQRGLESQRHCDVRALKVGDGLSYTWRDVTERVELIEKYPTSRRERVGHRLRGRHAMAMFNGSRHRAEMLGWDPDELLGTSIFDLIFEDDQAKTCRARSPSRTGGRVRASRPAFAQRAAIFAGCRSRLKPLHGE